jgi:hypothetical protein
MIIQTLLFIACSTLADAPVENPGVIDGIVVNASQENAPVGECKVVLRVRTDSQFVIFGEATADRWGRFHFENLPVGKYCEYIPGANRDGVHYPGPQVQLTAEQPHAVVEMSVCDSISAPSPLVLSRQEIRLQPESGVLRVSETLVVDNPSSTCYVGQATGEGTEPVTLQLNISPDFERVTFDEEYFGRHFAAFQGKLVTGLPWPPGKKELKFTYVIRNAEISRTWKRPLDLPCADISVRVDAEKPEEVACNLSSAAVEKTEKADQNGKNEKSAAIFQSAGKPLPAGYIISVDLAHLPVPWMAYARWTALAVLIGAVVGAGIFTIRRRASLSHPSAEYTHNPDPIPDSRRSRQTPGRGSPRMLDDTRKRRISP